jgi:predicted nuclease of predicted toxin-antitoxin system
MRSLSDLCIPDIVHDYLRRRGWGIVHAKDLLRDGQPDENVWAHSRRENRVLISADNDFHNSRHFPLNNHPGCIMLDTLRGHHEGEQVTDLMIRILATAMLHMPTHLGMRESKGYLDANSGNPVRRDGTRIALY